MDIKNLYNNLKTETFFILGPCVFDNRDNALKIADAVAKLKEKYSNVEFIYKASFDKANRQSVESYRGIGLEKSLALLSEIKKTYKLPVLTDIHESYQAELIKDIVDIIQIPAFLARQTDLLISAGKTNKIINIKKGQMMSSHQMILSAKKVESTANKMVMLTERGTFMGYGDLVVDYRNIIEMKKTPYPVIFDATHSVQKIGSSANVSSGNREYVKPLAFASVNFGTNGIFMEVHPDPDKALCDGANSVNLEMMNNIVSGILKLKELNKIL